GGRVVRVVRRGSPEGTGAVLTAGDERAAGGIGAHDAARRVAVLARFHERVATLSGQRGGRGARGRCRGRGGRGRRGRGGRRRRPEGTGAVLTAGDERAAGGIG